MSIIEGDAVYHVLPTYFWSSLELPYLTNSSCQLLASLDTLVLATIVEG